MMHEREKSDRPVAPMKPANKTTDFWSFVEELAEGRGLAKENEQDTHDADDDGDDRAEHGTTTTTRTTASPLRAIKRHSRKRPCAPAQLPPCAPTLTSCACCASG